MHPFAQSVSIIIRAQIAASIDKRMAELLSAKSESKVRVLEA